MNARIELTMKARVKRLAVVFSCVAASSVLAMSKSKGVPDGWTENFEQALAQSAVEGKHVLVCACASDDEWVMRESKPLHNVKFAAKARKSFVLMMVDLANDPSCLSDLAASQNPWLRRQLGLIPYPGRIVIVNCEGTVIKRMDDLRGDSLARWRRIDSAIAGLPKAVKRSPVPGAGKSPAQQQADGGAVCKPASAAADFDANAPEKIPGTGKSTPDGWMDDFYAAQQIAARENKLLFVVFSGSDWCGWCKKFADELLRKSAFQNAVKEGYVLVYIDSPRDKSLLSAKCLEQNSLVKEMLGARGGVPETIIATAAGEKLISLGGCSHVERGAESYLEFFRPLDKALRVIAAARKAAEAAGDGTPKADEILHKAYLEVDEGALIDHFSADVNALLSRRKEYLPDFPFFEYVMPVKKEFEALRSEMMMTANRAAYGPGRKYDRDKFAEAKRDFFNERIGNGRVAKWLEALSAADSKVTGGGRKRWMELKARVIGLKNEGR